MNNSTAKPELSSMLPSPREGDARRALPFDAKRREGRSRSLLDLTKWALELVTEWGFANEYGFHAIEWSHDDSCPLHPKHGPPYAWTGCRCQPDGVLLLHVGTPEERRVEVVRDGMPLGRSAIAEVRGHLVKRP